MLGLGLGESQNMCDVCTASELGGWESWWERLPRSSGGNKSSASGLFVCSLLPHAKESQLTYEKGRKSPIWLSRNLVREVKGAPPH